MDLEKMLEAAIQKALATQMPQQGEIVKADDVAAKVLESVKSELPALVKAAMTAEIEREGVGSKRTMQGSVEATLESDPTAYLIAKAKNVKSLDEWSVEDRGVIAGIFVQQLAKGMLGSESEDED